MDFVLLRVFPVALLVGGLALGWGEFRHYLQERPHVPLDRIVRRLAGSLLLVLLAVLVMLGRIPDRHSMPTEELWSYFRHWLWVMVIALVLLLLAGWDALAGVRHLRGYLEGVEREEIQKIHHHLAGPPEEK